MRRNQELKFNLMDKYLNTDIMEEISKNLQNTQQYSTTNQRYNPKQTYGEYKIKKNLEEYSNLIFNPSYNPYTHNYG